MTGAWVKSGILTSSLGLQVTSTLVVPCLCLIPTNQLFPVLPAHSRDPFHEDVTKCLAIAFGNIIPRYQDTEHDPTGTLSLLLASMIHHIDWICGIVAKYPGYPFSSLPILSEQELLTSLQENVTLEPTVDVPMATGVPPHINHSIGIARVETLARELKTDMGEYANNLTDSVAEAIDNKLESEGGVNHSVMKKALEEMKDSLLDELKISFDEFSNASKEKTNPLSLPPTSNRVNKSGFQYYSGRW